MEMNILNMFPDILSYVGEEIFIMCMIGQYKFLLDANHAIIQIYNKMHSSFKVQVKWGISGFHPTKLNDSHLFQTSVGQFSFVG
jgi:hypothetical protein